MQKKALMYRRVSTAGQVEKFGLPIQEHSIREYCEKNSIILFDGKEVNLDGFVDAGISGAMDDDDDDLKSRAALQGAFKYLEENPDIDYIIVHSKSRLWRNDDAKSYITRRLRRLDVDIISVCELQYSIFENRPVNRLMNGITDLVDEYERDEIKVKLANARSYKAKETKTKPAGVLPYGYCYSINKKNVNIEEHEARIIRIIFDIATKNMNEYGKSGYKNIADILNERKYATRRGNPWTKQGIQAILSNDFYISVLSYGEKIKGTHTALVGEETWKTVNPEYTFVF